MTFSATDINSFQYVLICKAGLAVAEKREMSKPQLESDIFLEFTQAVSKCTIPGNLQGMNSALLLRSNNFLIRSCEPKDLHTGDSLWRKYAEIKRVVVNDFTDLYNSFIPCGQPPSGLSLEDVVYNTRVAVWKRYDLRKCATNTTACPNDWKPTEWLVFNTYGKPSPNPQTCFDIE